METILIFIFILLKNFKKTTEMEDAWTKFFEERNLYVLFKNLDEEKKEQKERQQSLQLEEKIRLFDELIQIDGEEWRKMISDLDKKERKDERKRLKEMEREEIEDWENTIKEVERKQKMDKIIEQLVFLLTNKKN